MHLKKHRRALAKGLAMILDNQFSEDRLPRLGFGGMFGHGKTLDMVPLDELASSIEFFFECGYNFFDNAFAYDAEEPALERVLFSKYDRESYEVSQKITPWKMSSPEQMRKNFEHSLQTTSVGYYDYLMLHNVSTQGNRAEKFKDCKAWEFLLEQKERGLAKKIGFSFHDKPEMLESFIAEHPEAEFVMLQVNYFDWNNPLVCARQNCEIALKHNLPIFVMKPFRGGVLARPPEKIAQAMKKAGVHPIELALGFLASILGIDTIFCTMNTRDEVGLDVAGLRSGAIFPPDLLNGYIEQTLRLFNSSKRIDCVDCRYCIDVCPKNIRIPWILQALNDRETFGSSLSQRSYLWETNFGGRASDCISCGRCIEQCSTHLDIPSLLAHAVEVFESDLDKKDKPSW